MSGLVYFIVAGSLEAVKIGYTSGNPRARLSALQIGCPAKLHLYATVPATQQEERLLHQAFRPLHIHGEWFRYEGKLRDFACYLTDCAGDCQAGRVAFENALHDVLLTGLWYPYGDISEDEYNATGDWTPFRNLLEDA